MSIKKQKILLRNHLYFETAGHLSKVLGRYLTCRVLPALKKKSIFHLCALQTHLKR